MALGQYSKCKGIEQRGDSGEIYYRLCVFFDGALTSHSHCGAFDCRVPPPKTLIDCAAATAVGTLPQFRFHKIMELRP